MTAAARFDRQAQHRRQMLAKVHIAKKALGLTEDDYRAVLVRVTGLESAGDMDAGELEKVLAEFESKGFSAKARGPKAAAHPVAMKARAMWISLHQLGAITNPSEQALEAFACRQVGVTKWHWMNQSYGYRLIEALKAMAERHGWSQSVPARADAAAKVAILRRALAEALLAKLQANGLVPAEWSVLIAAERLGGHRTRSTWGTASINEIDEIVRILAGKLAAPIAPVRATEIGR